MSRDQIVITTHSNELLNINDIDIRILISNVYIIMILNTLEYLISISKVTQMNAHPLKVGMVFTNQTEQFLPKRIVKTRLSEVTLDTLRFYTYVSILFFQIYGAPGGIVLRECLIILYVLSLMIKHMDYLYTKVYRAQKQEFQNPKCQTSIL